MNTQFTPGPWGSLRLDDWFINSANRELGGEDGYGNGICQIPRNGCYRPEPEALANLRLIKAAPNLYEALCDMVSDHEKLSPSTLDFARKALAKARGEEGS